MPSTTDPVAPLLTQLRALIPETELTLIQMLKLIHAQAGALRSVVGVTDVPRFAGSAIARLPIVRLEDTALPLRGYSYWNAPENRWVIGLSIEDTAQSRRFTLLHEFAHILWHGKEHRLFPAMHEQDVKRIAEHAADIFAREVLVPRRLATAAYHRGLRTPAQIALLFNVSHETATKRLESMDLTAPVRRPVAHHARTPNVLGTQLAEAA